MMNRRIELRVDRFLADGLGARIRTAAIRCFGGMVGIGMPFEGLGGVLRQLGRMDRSFIKKRCGGREQGHENYDCR